MKAPTQNKPPASGIVQCRTGIRSLNEITDGRLPCGRPTLICGAAGCGKTLLAKLEPPHIGCGAQLRQLLFP